MTPECPAPPSDVKETAANCCCDVLAGANAGGMVDQKEDDLPSLLRSSVPGNFSLKIPIESQNPHAGLRHDLHHALVELSGGRISVGSRSVHSR